MDANLGNLATLALATSMLAFGVGGLASLFASRVTSLMAGEIMSTAGIIAHVSGLLMAGIGSTQVFTGLLGYSLGGDHIGYSDRVNRTFGGTLNTIFGLKIAKSGLNLYDKGNSIVDKAIKSWSGSKQLLLDAPSGTNPWLNGSEIKSIVAPKDFKINMAMSQNQTLPGGWGTLDNIDDVNFVRNQLAVTPEFKADIAKVQQFSVPEGIRIQIGIAGPQTYNGVTYPGGGNQVQILNYLVRSKLIQVGNPIIIK